MENILPGETGVVVAAGDADALYQAMAGLVADAELRKAMGRAGRRYAMERTIETAFEDYWAMYATMPTGRTVKEQPSPATKDAYRMVHAA